MRVVAGSAGGLKLDVPKTDLRPTMDMVRGAIFSSLANFIVDAAVLDLFAGTGGLGIEALSRGAASATFVDSDRRASEAIARNLERTRLQGEIHLLDIFSYLDRLAPADHFDLILADPPYAKSVGERDFAPELLANESLFRALKPTGVFILEHLPGAKLPLGSNWECFRQKRYGATEVAFLRKSAESAVA